MNAEQLRTAREGLGLSRYQLARQLGVSESTLSRWERGLMLIERPEMLRLALEALQLRQAP